MMRSVVFAVAISCAAASANACEKIASLTFSGQSVAALVKLNGAPVLQTSSPDSVGGGLPVGHWFIEGRNVLEVASKKAGERTPVMELEIQETCRGAMVDSRGGGANPLAKVAQKGAGVARSFFVRETESPSPFADAPKTDGAGLAAAVEALQKAFRDKDRDAIMAFHAPMFRLAAQLGQRGFDRMVDDLLQNMLPKGETTFVERVSLAPALDGKVFAATGPDGFAAPVRLSEEVDGGVNWFETGRFWAKIDGAWRVVAN